MIALKSAWLLIIISACFLPACNSAKKLVSKTASLKEAYKNDFLIGAAINAAQVEEKEPNVTALIAE